MAYEKTIQSGSTIEGLALRSLLYTIPRPISLVNTGGQHKHRRTFRLFMHYRLLDRLLDSKEVPDSTPVPIHLRQPQLFTSSKVSPYCVLCFNPNLITITIPRFSPQNSRIGHRCCSLSVMPLKVQMEKSMTPSSMQMSR